MTMKRTIGAVVVLGLVAVACGKPSPPAVKKAKATKTTPPPVICPLTGKTAPGGFDKSRPALAIKIDNAVAARPQAGLDSADIVYEELAEGGVTRFMAVYHCGDAARVGPVRSARLVDPDLLREYAPVLFGYSGANSVVLQKVGTTSGVIDLRHGSHGKAYQRVKGRPGPHDLFTSTGNLRALSEVRGAPQTGLTFLSAAPVYSSPKPSPKATSSSSATPASPTASASPTPSGSAVSFSFAGAQTVRYLYDPASGAYLRFLADKPFKVENGSQVRAVNVVVLKVKIGQGYIRDAAGNVSPEIVVTGGGEAFVLYAGQAFTARWTRDSLTAHMRLVDASGNDLRLAPGNTWIHLLPSDRAVVVE